MAQTQKEVKHKKSITLIPNLERRLRKLQAKLIAEQDSTWSLSSVLNIALSIGLPVLEKKKLSEIKRVD